MRSLARQHVRIRTALFVSAALPAIAAAGVVTAFAIAHRHTMEAEANAVDWTNHALMMSQVTTEMSDFVVDAGAMSSEKHRLDELRTDRRKILDLENQSVELARGFDDDEAIEELAIAQELRRVTGAILIADERRDGAALGSAIDTYLDDVFPKLRTRADEEQNGGRAAVEAAHAAERRSLAFAGVIALALLAVAFGCEMWIVRRLATGLRDVVNAAAELSRGNLDVVRDDGNDELAAVARAFNAMAASLRTTMIRKSDLETHLDARTNELRAKSKELEDNLGSLRETQSQLLHAEKMAAVGVLAAGTAHEINNPLSFVLANLAFVRDALSEAGSPADDEERRELVDVLEEARNGADRMKRIVTDLKTFSRASSDAALEPIDVSSAIEAAVHMTAHQIRFRAELAPEIDQSLPPVRANEGRLVQVIVNLLVNAVQALPPREPQANRIVVRARRRGDRIAIEVADNGVGIPADVQRRIFEPFFTTKAVGVGTGLGLSVCRNIVLAFGGDIEVESEPGAGACFRLLLLPAVAFAESPRAISAASIMRATPVRVLAIDDEPLVLRAIARALGSGAAVTTTTDGHDAIARIARGERFDVVLCDLTMPGMTGMDVHREIARVAPELMPRLVFLTGGAFLPETQAFLEKTPVRVLDKPFDPDELRAFIASMAPPAATPATRACAASA